jgi:hypothetical protein
MKENIFTNKFVYIIVKRAIWQPFYAGAILVCFIVSTHAAGPPAWNRHYMHATISFSSSPLDGTGKITVKIERDMNRCVLFRPILPLTFCYYDSQERLMPGNFATGVILSELFLRGEVAHMTSNMTIPVPDTAVFVRIKDGSGVWISSLILIKKEA